MVNFRIRFYSQELLFFIYDSSLPDTDIHDHQNNFTDSIFFGTTESFWNICTINTVHNCKSWYFIILFAYFNLVENKIPLYWFILLCLRLILLCLNVNFMVWTCELSDITRDSLYYFTFRHAVASDRLVSVLTFTYTSCFTRSTWHIRFTSRTRSLIYFLQMVPSAYSFHL